MVAGSDLIKMDGILGSTEIHVWHTDLTAQEAAIDRLSSLLDHHEQKRAAHFLVPEPRIQFILSRAFLRITLGQYLQIEPREVHFRTAEHGKPELAGEGDLYFTLSHTEGMTMIALPRAAAVGFVAEGFGRTLI